MENIAVATINSFGLLEGQAQPDDQLILTRGQLREIIQAAIQPFLERIEVLEEDMALERARDRQRIAKLERKEPQPLQKDRGEILRALLASNGGKMLAKDARRMMHLSESRFSELLSTMTDYVEVKPFHLRKNQNVLILK
jgi:hypothetical protein